MNQNKTQYWSTVHDDKLELVEGLSDFLQDEFCQNGADIMWSPEYFEWKLGSANPAGNGYISVAMEDGVIVGSISLTKKRLIINGIECIGAEIGDSYTAASIRRRGKPSEICSVDPDPKSYKNKSIFGRLASEVRQRAEMDGITIIYGTPNKFSYPGYIKKLDYIELSHYTNQSYFRPTSMLIIKHYPIFNKIYNLLNSIDVVFVQIELFRYKTFSNRKIKFDNTIPEDIEIDNLWFNSKKKFAFSLVRDAIYWRHRYQDHPLAKYEYFCARDNGVLVGIYITRRFSSSQNKSSISVVEWMAGDEVKFGYALTTILNHYKRSRVDFFHLWAQDSSKEAKAAAKTLFLLKRVAPIIIANTKQARDIKATSYMISFFLGSSDAI